MAKTENKPTEAANVKKGGSAHLPKGFKIGAPHPEHHRRPPQATTAPPEAAKVEPQPERPAKAAEGKRSATD